MNGASEGKFQMCFRLKEHCQNIFPGNWFYKTTNFLKFELYTSVLDGDTGLGDGYYPIHEEDFYLISFVTKNTWFIIWQRFFKIFVGGLLSHEIFATWKKNWQQEKIIHEKKIASCNVKR